MKIIEILKDILHKIFNIAFTEMTFIELVIAVLLVVLVYLVLKKLVSLVAAAFKKIFKFLRVSMSASEKCKHIQCNSCGRTLDKCVCAKNRNRSKLGRLIQYKKEKRNRR